MGKVIQLAAIRKSAKIKAQVGSDECRKCGHKLNVHITHPNGVTSCSARGCDCETRIA